MLWRLNSLSQMIKSSSTTSALILLISCLIVGYEKPAFGFIFELGGGIKGEFTNIKNRATLTLEGGAVTTDFSLGTPYSPPEKEATFWTFTLTKLNLLADRIAGATPTLIKVSDIIEIAGNFLHKVAIHEGEQDQGLPLNFNVKVDAVKAPGSVGKSSVKDTSADIKDHPKTGIDHDRLAAVLNADTDRTLTAPIPPAIQGTEFSNIEKWKATIIANPVDVPEPTSTLSLLALGTLGAASTLKRELKPSQSTEKETTKVG
jgi:hypothetical protein